MIPWFFLERLQNNSNFLMHSVSVFVSKDLQMSLMNTLSLFNECEFRWKRPPHIFQFMFYFVQSFLTFSLNDCYVWVTLSSWILFCYLTMLSPVILKQVLRCFYFVKPASSEKKATHFVENPMAPILTYACQPGRARKCASMNNILWRARFTLP